jgi:hypothetical protein
MLRFTGIKTSATWQMFTYLTFTVAALMMAGGIYFLDTSFAGKGFCAMAALMQVHTTATITDAIRDGKDSRRLHNKIDEARTERLMMEVAPGL